MLAFIVLLWPLYLRWLRAPAGLFLEHERGSIVEAAIRENAEARERLRETLPVCSAWIRFRSASVYEPVHGEFLFASADVAQALEAQFRENPHLRYGDDGELFEWVCTRDDAVQTPVDVPELWNRFRYIACDLVRSGKGHIRCLACQSEVAPTDVQPQDDKLRAGWNFGRLRCPRGHVLLLVELVHLHVSDHP